MDRTQRPLRYQHTQLQNKDSETSQLESFNYTHADILYLLYQNTIQGITTTIIRVNFLRS